MKHKAKLQSSIPSALLGLVLACSTNLSLAVGNMVLNTFDSADELSATDNNWSGGSCTWDGTQDAGGTASQGALYVTCPYSNPDPVSWQETQVGRNIPWPYIDLTPYVNFECDLKVDAANSQPASDGNYGQFQLAIQQWDWTGLGTVDVSGTSTNWTHIVIPLSPATTLAHLICDFHAAWNVYTTNSISYWIDNITLTVPPQSPMAMNIQRSGPGVEIDGTVINAGNSQRQYLRTANNDYVWLGARGAVTYSFTIADAPSIPTNVPEVDFYLVGNSPNPGGGVDWAETNVIYLQIAQIGTDTATYNAQLFYKTNAPNANSQYWGQRPAAIYGTHQLIGTWSVSFGTDNSVTLTSPDGTTNSGTFPPEAAAFFDTTVVPYIGIQPYGMHYPAVRFSHFSVTGAGDTLDDSFPDLTFWNKAASDNTGIVALPSDTVYQLSWLGPAAGYNLEQSFDLSYWSSSVAAGVTAPLLLGDYKKAWVPASSLPSGDVGYWRLNNPSP